MGLELPRFGVDDTNYVTKLNSICVLLEQIITGLQANATQGSTTSSPVTTTGGSTSLEALFGTDNAVIGSASYKTTINADPTKVDIAPGWFWMASSQSVLKIDTPYQFNFTGQSSGTKYIGPQGTGIPAVQTSSTNAVYSVAWDGTAVTAVTRLVPVVWGYSTFESAKHNAAIGMDVDELDDLLEAIGGASFTTLDVDMDDLDQSVSGDDAVRHGVLAITSSTDLSADRSLSVPVLRRPYVVHASFAGGFGVTVKTPSGTGVKFVDGERGLVYSNGTNVVLIAKSFEAAGKVYVSSNDTTSGFLNGKLVAGPGVTLTENNDGANETLTLTATGTGGTLTSVALAVPSEFSLTGSPITTSGTITIGKAPQSPNVVWAGPSSGGAAVPTFRALVAADLPDLSSTYQARSEKGAANGYAPLGSDSKVSSAYLPASILGGLSYQGTWNANTNSPSITTGSASSGNKGYYYKISVAGTTTVDGESDWKVGDWIVSNGTTWDKVDNTDLVSSVNGYVGAVVITTSDLSDFPESVDDRIATLLQQGTNIALTYNDASNTLTIACSLTTQPYDIAGFYPGAPAASAMVLYHVFNRAVTLPASLAGSNVYAETAATAPTTFGIQKNGVSIGSFTVGASSNTATFSFSSSVSFSVGDRLKVVAPATPDATLADIAITFSGTRSI